MAKADDNARWAKLMAQSQAGNKASYRKLLAEIYPYIRNILMTKVSRKEAIDDIAQEIVISVHSSMNTYDASRPFKPWLHSIISYRTIDFFRKHYKKITHTMDNLDFAAHENDFVTNTAHAGEYKDIETAMKTLPKKQREVFELMRLQGYTAEEVSTKTGMSPSAVKVSVHRSANKLKEMLG